MNPNRHGWFDSYIRYRREHPLPERLPTFGVRLMEDEGLHNESDQAIYFFLQPTGLLYGAPLAYPFPEDETPRSRFYDRLGRALIIQLDAMMACAVADRHYLLAGLVEEAHPLDSAIRLVEEYHAHYPPEFGDGQGGLENVWSLLRRRRGEHLSFEDEFQRRVLVRGNLLLLRTPVANIFLFLDLYHCLLWQRRRLLEGAEPPEALLAQYREQMTQREVLLKLIVATLYTDRRVDPLEWRLVERLLRASLLPPERQHALRQIARNGIALEQIQVPEMPWLIRRSFMDLIVMAVYLDRHVDERESALLEQAVERLGLWREELDQSRAAFEAFLLHHGRTFSYGQKANLFNLTQHLREQASLAIRRNLDRIVREIKETHELYALLLKSTRMPLTSEEKRRVRGQLLDILKTIPALAVFALPGGGIILPILIRLLPFNLLPSSFED